jgi:proteasome lid subunit RPN8/RPN11
LLQAYTEAKEFEKAVKKSMDMVDVFHSHPVLLWFSIQSIGSI